VLDEIKRFVREQENKAGKEKITE